MACQRFVTHCNSGRQEKLLEYRGESAGALAARAFEALLRPRARKELPRETKDEVISRQGGLCAYCDDELGKDTQFDHLIPRSVGGSDEASNLRCVCSSCHGHKCYAEALSSITDPQPLLSRFNRETYNQFVQAPKPPQLVARLHEPLPDEAVMHLDVRRCRYNGFLQNSHPLPVFCALDEIMPAVHGQLGDYSFVVRTRDLRSPRKLLPSWGPGWYWRAEVEFLLDAGIVTWGEITHSFTASAHFPAALLHEKLRQLEDMWTASQADSIEIVDSKNALNAMFGVWSIRERHRYTLMVSSDRDDVLAAVRRTPSPGSPVDEQGQHVFHDYVSRTELLTLSSMRPVHQICLAHERLTMARALYVLGHLCKPQRVLALQTDAIYVQPGARAWKAVEAALDVTYADLPELVQKYEPLRAKVSGRLQTPASFSHAGAAAKVFRLKKVDSPTLPGGVLVVKNTPVLETARLEWTVHEEPEDGPDDFAERALEHVVGQRRPLLVTGPAGAGKTHLLLNIIAGLKAAGERVKMVALTHVACRRLGDAETAHHFAHHHVLGGSYSGWLIIDEVFMLPAMLLTILENLAVAGVKILAFGDPHQLPPPVNTWRSSEVCKPLDRSRLLWHWAGGTRFHLTRCRRSNREHFDRCLSLLGMPLEAAKQKLLTECAGSWEDAEQHLVLSHRRRMRLNALCQRKAAKACGESMRASVRIASDAHQQGGQSMNRPQDFELFVGTRLLGANNEVKGIVNGGLLLVTEVSAGGCTVRDERDKDVALTLEQVTKCTRLAWAMTITSCQSREFDGKVAVWDLDSKHFSLAHLYVAATRVKHGSRLVVVPPEQRAVRRQRTPK